MAKKERLPTKISRPRLSGIVLRERLFRLLDAGRRKKALWISGPAGAGKTTLVASYVDSRGIPCIWYQMDEGDADPATFFYYLGLAAKYAAPRRREPLPLLTPEYLAAISTFSKRYFEALAARLKQPFLLVFDNYQDVPADALLHEILRQGLAALPDGIRAVLVSRTGPLPAFARYAANQELSTITLDELRFTEKESREFIRAGARDKVPAGLAAELQVRTQGWAAGLVLYRELLRTAGLEQGFADRQASEGIFRYFAGELFDKTTPETQQFLLKTSFLPTISPQGAESLGLPQAERVLAELTRKNFFTVRTKGPRPGHQYHPLFREFLLDRAQKTFGRETFAALRRSAATVMSGEGNVEEAIELLLDSEDVGGLASLVIAAAPSLFAQGRIVTLEKWLAAFSSTTLEEIPWLLYWRAVCRLPFDPAAARRYLEQAFALFSRDGSREGKMLAVAGIIETCVHESDDFSVLDRWIAMIEPMMEEDGPAVAAGIRDRLTGSMYAALVLRQPHHPDLDQWERRADGVMAGDQDAQFRTQLGFHMAVYALWSGHFIRLKMVLDMLRKIEEEGELTPLMRLSIRLSEIMYGWLGKGDHAAALRLVEESLAYSAETGVRLWDFHLLGHGAAAALSAGDTRRAESLLDRMAPVVVTARRIDRAYYHQLRLWLALLRNDVSSAIAQHPELVRAREGLGLPFGEALCDVDSAYAMHLLGRHAESDAYLTRARKLAGQMQSHLILFMIAVAEAFFAYERREEVRGLRALREAMAVGREQGYVTSHLWRADVMARLCVKALEQGIEEQYVRDLIVKCRLAPESPPLHLETWPWQYRIFTLSRFTVIKDGKPLRFAGRVRQKPLELLKALIAQGGRDVAVWSLIEALWPDAEGDAAQRSFDTTLHRLRTMLGGESALLLREGRLSLDSRLVWVDAWAFERLLGMAAAAPAEAGAALVEKALALYEGHFLREESHAWAVSMRERLRGKCLRAVMDLGKIREEQKDGEGAVRCYERGIEIDDLAEEFYRRIISLYLGLGRYAEGIAVYRRCSEVLRARHGIDPSDETETLYKETLRAAKQARM